MTRVLGPGRVPAGFTITTEVCVAYMNADRTLPSGLDEQLAQALSRLEDDAGKALGDPKDPLLVSVRSGARESMPGMMYTVLNLGMNDESVVGLAERTGNERFAWDSYRRFVQMYGNVVLGIEGEKFEDAIKACKKARGVTEDTELEVDALRQLTATFKGFFAFPADPREQLVGAIRAVFDSWMGKRALEYRRINRIPDDWGTAVNVQQMVFCNKGDTSGSGVAFSRDEITGEPEPSGDFLPNAQGEDVVSGVRTPRDIRELKDWQPEVHAQLMDILRILERHYGDMQDTEFTVEDGELYMLQTRNAKRPAQAAVRFAVDAVREGLLDKAGALTTIDADKLDALLHPTRAFTEADDVAGFHAAKGVLTAEGGKASHSPLVARGMGVPRRHGCRQPRDRRRRRRGAPGRRGRPARGRPHGIDGTVGCVTTDDVPLVEPKIMEHLLTVLEWADELRHLGVRANADTPADARKARELGARGIGLCGTEHMFLGERQPLMADVILAGTEDERAAAVDRLLPLQRKDFEEIFAAMNGLPVTIRLLDPPLHEFLPRPETLEPGPRRDRVVALQETNPMLGTRGARLGILFPELYAMQVRAIGGAMLAHHETWSEWPQAEIMVPLVVYERELEMVRAVVERELSALGLTHGQHYSVGTMIELPRACTLADRIAAGDDFFSFGTNDLTQTALGFSRDDIEARVLGRYIDMKVFDRSPFETLDQPGVGQLVRMGAWLGRKTRPALKLGVCGEHGGDPDSIDFFHHSGIDYVSCSPYRVPVARLAAAQAAIRGAA
jgi:pyruvate,orthophosphate dikinase